MAMHPLKLQVIAEARTHVTAGAHYLWSAAGNTPGKADGAPFRPGRAKLHANVPDPQNPKPNHSRPTGPPFTPTLFAAYAVSERGTLVCAGRAIVTLTLAVSLDPPKALDLKLRDLTPDHLAELKKHVDSPSSYRWPRPNGPLGNAAAHHSTAWGESCVDKRHFDCIGLINYCLSKVLQRTVQYAITSFTGDPTRGQQPLFKEVPLRSAQLCDIVTRGTSHIGLVTERGTVIEAKDIVHGVVESDLHAGPWKQCFRFPDRDWRIGA